MGLLVDGKWKDEWYDTESTGGRFRRSASQFRNWVTADGSPGPSGSGGFEAKSGRYHLYGSYACPWVHRTLLMRAWKGLEQHVGLSVVHPLMLSHGWELRSDFEGATGDTLYGLGKIYELYQKADSSYSGRATVPVLWDKQQETIVSNESADIVRMLNSAFNEQGAKPGDYYPESQRDAIDKINETVYGDVNNGVYKAGFATSQEAYDEAVSKLFDALDRLDKRLGESRFLIGDVLTEADLRLWTTLVRFDQVYMTHFKCDRSRIRDYANLHGLLCDVYQLPGVAETVHMDHIRHHYFRSHPSINPHGIISIGPEIDFSAPNNRDSLGMPNVCGV